VAPRDRAAVGNRLGQVGIGDGYFGIEKTREDTQYSSQEKERTPNTQANI